MTGTLAAQLVAEGLLDENKYCRDYLPELEHSAFADATIRQVLDMTTGLDFSEDYADPKAEIWAFSKAGDPFKLQRSPHEPANYFDYLKTVRKKGLLRNKANLQRLFCHSHHVGLSRQCQYIINSFFTQTVKA